MGRRDQSAVLSKSALTLRTLGTSLLGTLDADGAAARLAVREAATGPTAAHGGFHSAGGGAPHAAQGQSPQPPGARSWGNLADARFPQARATDAAANGGGAVSGTAPFGSAAPRDARDPRVQYASSGGGEAAAASGMAAAPADPRAPASRAEAAAADPREASRRAGVMPAAARCDRPM